MGIESTTTYPVEISEMLGCAIRYHADSAPDVIPANADRLDIDAEAPFRSEAC
jgi:hypothetical protein